MLRCSPQENFLFDAAQAFRLYIYQAQAIFLVEIDATGKAPAGVLNTITKINTYSRLVPVLRPSYRLLYHYF